MRNANPFNLINGLINGQPGSLTQRLGYNMGIQGYSDYANQWLDFGDTLSWNHSGGGTFDANGYPASGTCTLTWFCREGEVFEAGDYQFSWPGAGTINGSSSPLTVTVTAGATSVSRTSSGAIGKLSARRVGMSGDYTSTGSARANRAESLRPMQLWRVNPVTANNETYESLYVRQITPGANTRQFPLITATRLADYAQAHGCDLFLSVPHLASDADVTQIGTEVAASTFTGTLRVEHSNEVWNGDWAQHSHAMTQATSAGGYPVGTNPDHARMQWHYDETNRWVGLIKAQYANTIGVLGSQAAVPAYGQNDGGSPNLGIQGTQSGLANCTEWSIAPYFGQVWINGQTESALLAMSNQQLADGIYSDWTGRVLGLVQQWQAHATAQGRGLNFYEFGPSMNKPGGAQQHLADAMQSSEVAAVTGQVLDWVRENGNHLVHIYQAIGGPADEYAWLRGELATNSPSPIWNEFLTRSAS